jgi:hypothetical protein
MMKNFIYKLIIIVFLLTPALEAYAQSEDESNLPQVFETSGLPQWVKDFRRYDIVAFGSFPFAFFFTNFFYDLYRWNSANGMDFSAEGRRYAPWPFRSAGGIEMSSREIQRVILIAAGISLAIALIDYIIVRVKRDRELRRLESISSGGVSVDRRTEEETDETDTGESAPE